MSSQESKDHQANINAFGHIPRHGEAGTRIARPATPAKFPHALRPTMDNPIGILQLALEGMNPASKVYRNVAAAIRILAKHAAGPCKTSVAGDLTARCGRCGQVLDYGLDDFLHHGPGQCEASTGHRTYATTTA